MTKLFAVVLVTAISYGITEKKCFAAVTVAPQEKFAQALQKSSGLLNILATNKTKKLSAIITALKVDDERVLKDVTVLAQDADVVSIAMTGTAEKSNPAIYALQTLWYVLTLKATEEFVKDHFLTEQATADGLERQAFIHDFKTKFAVQKTIQNIQADLVAKIIEGLDSKLTGWRAQIAGTTIKITNGGLTINQDAVDAVFTETLHPLIDRITKAHNFTQKVLALAETPAGLDTILFSECITITEPEHPIRKVTLYAFIQEEANDILNLLETGVAEALDEATAHLDSIKTHHGDVRATTIEGTTTKARAQLRQGFNAVLAEKYTVRMRGVAAIGQVNRVEL